MALVVCGLYCVGLAVLAFCVLLWCVLSVWLWGFGSARGSRVPGLAWPCLEGAAALRLRSVCHVVVGRRGGVGGERGWERGALHDPIVYNDS